MSGQPWLALTRPRTPVVEAEGYAIPVIPGYRTKISSLTGQPWLAFTRPMLPVVEAEVYDIARPIYFNLFGRVLVFELTPQLVGLTQLAAQAILQNDVLVLGSVTFASSTAYPVGIISAQLPIFNTPIVLGGTVNIVLSTGHTSPVVMPNQSSRAPNLPNKILPPDNQLVDERGVISTNWWRFLLNVSQQAFGIDSTQPATVTVGASPFVFTAVVQGTVLVAGGPVSLIEYSKDMVTWFPMGIVQGPIQVVPKDSVRITYTHAPAVTFFPR